MGLRGLIQQYTLSIKRLWHKILFVNLEAQMTRFIANLITATSLVYRYNFTSFKHELEPKCSFPNVTALSSEYGKAITSHNAIWV